MKEAAPVVESTSTGLDEAGGFVPRRRADS